MYRSNTTGWLFVAPSVVFLILIGLVPTIYVLYLSFTNVQLGVGGEFVGYNNYMRAFSDPRFQSSAIVTFQFVFFGVSIQLLLGLIIAIGLNALGTKSRKLLSAVVLLPLLVPSVVVGMLWRLLLRPRVGLVSHILEFVGIDYVPWFDDSRWAMAALILADVWQWTPFVTIIILAALQSIPQDLYEAAAMDNASPWTAFRKITLPMLAPVMVLAGSLRAVDAFKSFDLIMVMTRGGPGSSTETLAYYTYIQGFTYFDIGLTSAMSIVQLAIILVVSRFVLKRLGVSV